MCTKIRRLESTAALRPEIGRRITEAMGESREIYWLVQRDGLAVQRRNALSIGAAVREKYDIELWASCSMQPVAIENHHYWSFVGAVTRAVWHNSCFQLLINKDA